MQDLTIFQHFGITDGQSQFATRTQIELLYQVPRKTLSDNIKDLKKDGLINGAKIRHVAQDGKQRLQEVFDLNEVIAIGFRLRSDTAIRLQKYASNLLVEKMQAIAEEKRTLELELSYAWNKSDQKDLYRQ
ncbi:hypothetical protein LDL77_06455 [Flagellimonas marinaquae]|uniref:hypothetical protein n=1 Tax=Flagellimonas aurea TaxID=2915619 RepID=UPI001CE1F924|nr:hypothetical protein LDL77_06455 [Allomuricauda aquimarina]